MIKKIVILSLTACMYSSLQAQIFRNYSNEFLNIGVDARSIAMGSSVVAGVEGITAGFWNPAGLAGGNFKHDAALMHSEYFASIANFDYGAYAHQLPNEATVSASFIRFAVDDIQNTLNLVDENGQVDYSRITKFSAADYALLLSFAQQSKKREGLQYGATMKLIYRNIGEFANAFGFGFDVGMQYKTEKWRFGAVARDITSTFNAWSINTDLLEEAFEETGNDLPENNIELTAPRLIGGVGRMIEFSDSYKLLIESNLNIGFAGRSNDLISFANFSIAPSLGLEFNYNELIYLRLGSNNFQFFTDFDNSRPLIWQPTFGLGLQFKNFKVDYAIANMGRNSGFVYSNVFSLRYSFGSI